MLAMEQPTSITLVFGSNFDNTSKVDDDESGENEFNIDNDVPSPDKFSHLLHCFRIFLLIYHSVTWSGILRTTGISRQQNFEEILD